MGPNKKPGRVWAGCFQFQSSVRINVGPNNASTVEVNEKTAFQSSVRINVGPNSNNYGASGVVGTVSILRED